MWRYGASVLPDVTSKLDSGDYDDVLKVLIAADSGDEDDYTDKTDWFLCFIVPSMKPACVAFYEDVGPRLAESHNAHYLRKLDAYLCAQLDVLHASMELDQASEMAREMKDY